MSEKSNFLHLTWYLAFRKQNKNVWKNYADLPQFLLLAMLWETCTFFPTQGGFVLKSWSHEYCILHAFFQEPVKSIWGSDFLVLMKKMRLICSYVLSILGKNSLILKKKKCDFVLNFTELRLKLFLFLGKSVWGSCS